MKNYFLLFLFYLLVFCQNAISAQAVQPREISSEKFPNSTSVYESKNYNLTFYLNGGYRIDQLDWSIAGYLGDDYWNVLSELIWRDLKIVQVKFGNETIIKDKYYFRGEVGKGVIFSGSNQDTDFNGNNRTNPWSQSKNDSNDGSVFDFSLGFGYIFKPLTPRFRLTPLLGISYHNQDLSITDGYQTISQPIPDKQVFPAPVGSFPGLDSSYKTSWFGPWCGMDLRYIINKNNYLKFLIEYHWTDYYAKANWNLITRFEHPKSFEHESEGDGIVFGAKWDSKFYEEWHYTFDFYYQRWQTDPGIDRTFFSDGSVSKTPLNEVNWESLSLMIGISYPF